MVGDQRTDVRNRRTEGGCQKSEIGGQRSEVRGQRSEIGGRKAGAGGQRMKERCSARITRMGVNEKNAKYACLWHSA